MTALTTTGHHTIAYPVADLDAAKAVYTALFGEPHTDTPYYVGYAVGDQQIGLNPNDAGGATGPLVYWSVDDIAAARQSLLDAGATVLQEPQDVGGGTTLALLADATGNTIGLIQAEG